MNTETKHSQKTGNTNHKALVIFSVVLRIACILYGALSMLGFLFFGGLTPGMLAGFFAFAAAIIPASGHGSTYIIRLATLGLLCQVADVALYYMIYNSPGNYYAWPQSIVFFCVLALMVAYGTVTRNRKNIMG